ncbi:hypothetical protein DJ544_07300 [Enterobacter roggenkampii]|uniref:hypothetical protein n=1 Tax=Enterobacter roggenkampii TaxID=1812935 RepID=UPI0011E3C839|nr:hypothetical protein [Enterobacter roggenkampii]TYF69606.1 hypothetical protein DJ544_07300 [Enterobacter roggenkampii]
MAYGKNPFSKSPLPTGDFKTSQKRLTAEIKEVEGKKVIFIYYEGTNDVYDGPEATQYTTLEDAQGFCNNYNKHLNI